MLITRECDYALRLLCNLKTDSVTSIGSIAETENITNAIAYKVAGKLEKGGLIESVRGNRGGYKLKRGLDELYIFDVYNIMEPNGAINECLKEGADCPQNKKGAPCAVYNEFERIQRVLFKELGRKSLMEILSGE